MLADRFFQGLLSVFKRVGGSQTWLELSGVAEPECDRVGRKRGPHVVQQV